MATWVLRQAGNQGERYQDESSTTDEAFMRGRTSANRIIQIRRIVWSTLKERLNNNMQHCIHHVIWWIYSVGQRSDSHSMFWQMKYSSFYALSSLGQGKVSQWNLVVEHYNINKSEVRDRLFKALWLLYSSSQRGTKIRKNVLRPYMSNCSMQKASIHFSSLSYFCSPLLKNMFQGHFNHFCLAL